MKKWFLLICIAALLCGCASPAAESSYSFYYVQELGVSEIGSAFECKDVLVPENRPVMENASLLDILCKYLEGPASPILRNPFPKNLKIISADYQNDSVSILFSKEISNLSGIDLTLACAAIAKTCGDLIKCSSVTFQGEDVTLNNVKSITISVDSIIFAENPQSQE